MVLALIICIGLFIGIKALNLPGVITAVLVVAVLVLMMILLGKFAMKGDTEEENAKTSDSSLDKP